MSMNAGSVPAGNVQQSGGVTTQSPGGASRLTAAPAGTQQVAEARRVAPQAGTGRGLNDSVREGKTGQQGTTATPRQPDTDRTKKNGAQGQPPILGVGY